MCGIAGIFRFDGSLVDLQQVKSMTDSIVHRGPNGSGHWINDEGYVALGHRRLSIIDLSEEGHQPMHYLERYTITFNGEIYNYIELKEHLVKIGYTFKSESDTEVLLALYAEMGVKCLGKLDGMFALAIWDNLKKELFCARDRFGEKPFYYFVDTDQFIFGSEMKELWAVGVSKKIHEEKIEDYIYNGQIGSKTDLTGTYYYGINNLEPACYMLVRERGKIEKTKYWNLDLVKENRDISFTDAIDTYYSLFENSVRCRLRSDVPIGSSLSGGVDSSSIVCMVDKIKSGKQIQSVFSARFKDFDKDEGKYIRDVIENCKAVKGFETWPAEIDMVNLMDKVVFHQEEPFGSSSILAQWKVMELAKEKNVTVLLDGQGADECLAGYVSSYRVYLNQLFYENKKKYKLEYDLYMKNFGHEAAILPVEKTETMRMKIGRFKKHLLGEEVAYVTLKDRLRFMLNTSGLNQLLKYADRNSMAHSREVRLPFLSHELVEFVLSLPDEYLIHQGWTKYIHRKALEEIVPKSICWRKDKIGYEPPQKDWMRTKEVEERIKSQAEKYKVPKSEINSRGYTQSMEWRLFMSSYLNA